ncbi:MAG: amidase [Candidatus Eremiobacteraeota bacterium]|nr:amidase [Candidatus Eremiobacteraeota bacterium]
MTNEQLAFQDATAIGRMIAARKVSSVEMTKLYLDRLDKYGKTYGAVVTVMHERALREARAADRELAGGRSRGPLHGVPYGVKDLLAAVGAPTTWGAAPYRTQQFDFDGTVVQKLHAAGAVLLAKLAMVELAGGFGYDDADASFTGPGRTPWNRNFWSGGSSSGPGAATAAGLVGFAIGSETNGSILVPAAFCGVSGLRPTYGRVSRHGAMALMWTSDKLGPMCRSARDTELVLRAIAGKDPNDPTSRTMPFVGVRGRRPHIGVMANATQKTMPAVAQNFTNALGVLREFCDVSEGVTLPKGFRYGAVFDAIFAGECAAAFRDLIERGQSKQLQSVDDRLGGYQVYGALAVDYVDGTRMRTKIDAAVQNAFAPYDAVVYPTLSTVAYPVGIPFSKAYTQYPGSVELGSPGNLAGLPAMSVPNGWGEHNLPTGLGLLGRVWGEAQIASIAKSFQARSSFHARHPQLVVA